MSQYEYPLLREMRQEREFTEMVAKVYGDERASRGAQRIIARNERELKRTAESVVIILPFLIRASGLAVKAAA